MTEQEATFVEQCRAFLHSRWEEVTASLETGVFCDPLLPDHAGLRDHVVACLTSSTKSYRYCLPTQILAKCVNPLLDSHSLQASYSHPGAFDARTIAHKVIAPFDQENYRVLGGAPEPYVNNPLRCPAVTGECRNQQKNKVDWDRLIGILDAVEEENRKDFTEAVFGQVLAEMHRMLSSVQVLYPIPNRVSLARTTDIISRFTSAKSGGDRVEAVCTALFKTIACEFGLFDEVRRQKVNVADAASGMGADIECSLKGRVVILVEVKDRSLTMTQLDSKLDVARAKNISEILFLGGQGVPHTDHSKIRERIDSEFPSGQKQYGPNFQDFSAGVLILLGER